MLSPQQVTQEQKLPIAFEYIMQGNGLALKNLIDKKLINITETVSVDDLNVFLKYKPHWKLKNEIARQPWKNITLLHVAALLHEEVIVNLLLLSEANITQIEQDSVEANAGPYYFAELNESKNSISENLYMSLLVSGDFPPQDARYPYWHVVIKRNHIKLLKFLINSKFLKELYLDIPDSREFHKHKEYKYSYPLHYAACLGRYEMVAAFLEKGSDPDAREIDNQSESEQEDIPPPDRAIELPLYGAVKGNHIKVVNLLLEHKADITLNQEYNETRRPLDCAAFYGFNDILKRLCEAKANVSFPDEHDVLPAHHAAFGGNKEGLEILLQFNADILSAAANGYTILDYAMLGGHLNLFKYLRKKYPNLWSLLQLTLTQFENQAHKQNFIFSCFKEIYSHNPNNAFSSATDIIFLANKLTEILQSLCQMDEGKSLYDNIIKIIKQTQKKPLWCHVKLMDGLIFYLGNMNKGKLLLNSELKQFIKTKVCYQNELASFYLTVAGQDQVKTIFNVMQEFKLSSLEHEYFSDISFSAQATFANDFSLFEENAKLHQYVMGRLNICFADIRYLEPKRDLLAFMQTCSDPLMLTCKTSTGSTREYPLAIVYHMLSFLQPDYITHNNVKITTTKIISALETRCHPIITKLPENSLLQKRIVNHLINYYLDSNKEILEEKILLKRHALNDQIIKDIKILVRKLKKKQENINLEVKQNSTGVLTKIALIEQSLLQEAVSIFMSESSLNTADDLLKSRVVLTNLNKLILLKENKTIYKIYSIRERKDYSHSFFEPTKSRKVDKSNNQDPKRFKLTISNFH